MAALAPVAFRRGARLRCRRAIRSRGAPWLLLDDRGMAALDVQARSDLLEIIDDRAASKATIITSQLPIEHGHAWVGDATIADAVLDRLMQQNHRLTLAGESLRQTAKTP
ncbi:ATP-binding protein [Variovorax paradoxus]